MRYIAGANRDLADHLVIERKPKEVEITMAQKNSQSKSEIDTIQVTSDTLTSREGLTLFVR